ncbi:DNA-3-methyladenine glycosylase family protein [Paenibacillus terrigena]|uniref:DNA-3-methyladenine glycosylase family protein n=1 Tax=Paenibacillus terrigena TaxID=369333 RepID=UPI00037496FE|nr:DNA-3-methyladenine glycosylase 2 [Paenibacillus terrigena]
MERLIYEMEPRAPYDFGKMIRRLQGVNHEMFRFQGDRLLRTIRIDDQVLVLAVDSIGSIENPKLQIALYGEGLRHINDVEGLKQYIRVMLSADLDIQSFYDQLAADALYQPLVERFYGLRFILEADLFECMTKTIIGQQLNLAFASTLNRRMMELTAKPVMWEGLELPVFPSAQDVARLDYGQLRELQYSQRKAEYVIDLARLVAEGQIDLNGLFTKTNDEIVTELSRLRGIGRWTVECFLMFGMGRTDLLPAADIGLRNGVKKLYGMEDKPTEAEVRRIGAAWAPWSSYVTFYLWETLNDKLKERAGS